jgi:hypothetical protein
MAPVQVVPDGVVPGMLPAPIGKWRERNKAAQPAHNLVRPM